MTPNLRLAVGVALGILALCYAVILAGKDESK